jgi:hypothetical protein
MYTYSINFSLKETHTPVPGSFVQNLHKLAQEFILDLGGTYCFEVAIFQTRRHVALSR